MLIDILSDFLISETNINNNNIVNAKKIEPLDPVIPQEKNDDKEAIYGNRRLI